MSFEPSLSSTLLLKNIPLTADKLKIIPCKLFDDRGGWQNGEHVVFVNDCALGRLVYRQFIGLSDRLE